MVRTKRRLLKTSNISKSTSILATITIIIDDILAVNGLKRPSAVLWVLMTVSGSVSVVVWVTFMLMSTSVQKYCETEYQTSER